jgi:hypothetical protein
MNRNKQLKQLKQLKKKWDLATRLDGIGEKLVFPFGSRWQRVTRELKRVSLTKLVRVFRTPLYQISDDPSTT